MLVVKRALRIYEDSLCSCGHSSLLSHGAEGVGEYEEGTITCHACKAMESVKGDGKPGQKRFARDLHDDPPDDDEEES